MESIKNNRHHASQDISYESVIDSLTVPTFIIDKQHIVTAWNRACEQLTGVKAEDIIGTSDAWRGFYESPRSCLADVVIDQVEQHLDALYATHGKAKFGQGLHAESWFANINGKRRYMIFDAEPLYDTAGDLVGALENLQDVTEIKLAEEKAALSDKVFNHISQAILISNQENKVIAVNQSFTQLTGYSQEDIVGKNPNILSSGKQPPEFYKHMWQVLNTKGNWAGDIWDRRKNGEVYPKWMSITKVADEKTAEVSHYIAIFSDISERKKTEEEAHRLAFYDALTGLPNRLLLRDRLQQAIASAKRGSALVGVMFIDIDGFKTVNDSLGHETGDLLLQEIAIRMRDCLRQSDTVARLGGDEFVVILPDVVLKTNIGIVASKLLTIVEDIVINDNPINISLSIGVAVYPQNGDEIDALLQNADKAMYKVKKSGKNGFQYFQNSPFIESLTFRNK